MIFNNLIKKILFFIMFALCYTACKTDKKDGGNTVSVAMKQEPDNLNPLLYTNAYARQIIRQMFLPLVDFDPQTLELKPVLVKKMANVSPIDTGIYKGGLAYTYEILDEAVWDNGSPVVAEDYIFTIKAALNPKVNAAKMRSELNFIKKIQIDASNPKKFTVIADKSYIKGEEAIGTTVVVLPAYIYDPNAIMKNITIEELNSKDSKNISDKTPLLQKFADEFQQPKYSREKTAVVGCGGYALEDWVTGQKIVLRKKQNWWGNKLATQNQLLCANPIQIVYKFSGDENTTITGLKNEELDVMASISAPAFADLQKNEKVAQHYNLITTTVPQYFFLALNNENPYLNDKRVRKALAHCVNVDEIIKTLLKGSAERINSPFLPTRAYYDKSLPPIDFDIEKAKKLLEQAGWKDTNGDGIADKIVDKKKEELHFQFEVTPKPPAADMALMIKNEAKKAGIDIEIVNKEGNIINEDLKKRTFEIVASGVGQSPGLDDPFQRWHTKSETPDGSNQVGFGDATTDKLIDEIRTTLDTDKRNELYKKFQAKVYEEQPVIFLYMPKERLAIHKRWDNANTSLLRPGYFENCFQLKN